MDFIFKQGIVVFKFFKQFEAELLAELAKQPMTIVNLDFVPLKDATYCGCIQVWVKDTTPYPFVEVAAAHITMSGEVYVHQLYRQLYPHHLPVYRLIGNWGAYVLEHFHAAQRLQNFWKESKEELVATAWHPDRVGKWLDAGVDIEAM